MKDKEKAEEYTNDKGFGSDYNNITSSEANEEIEKAVLYGLEAGKPKWHDLRKDPNDLPIKTDQYLTNDGDICIYNTDCKKWRTIRCMACWYFDWLDDGEVTAWCEIPKFKG